MVPLRELYLRAGGDRFALHFLPRHKRDAVCALVAFAELLRRSFPRHTGAGGCGSGAGDVAGSIHQRIDEAYTDALQLPQPQFRDETRQVLAALGPVVRRYEVPPPLLHDLVDALAASQGVARVATWAALERHFDRTGGAVARTITAVLGATHSDAGDLARAAGVGAQLIATLAAVGADGSRGAVGLPLEDLARFRYSERELLAGESNPRLRELVHFEAGRARDLVNRAAGGVGWLAGDGARLSAAVWVTEQLATIAAIEDAPDPLHPRLPPPSLARRLRQLPAAWRLARAGG